jgi:hypothetical protein
MVKFPVSCVPTQKSESGCARRGCHVARWGTDWRSRQLPSQSVRLLPPEPDWQTAPAPPQRGPSLFLGPLRSASPFMPSRTSSLAVFSAGQCRLVHRAFRADGHPQGGCRGERGQSLTPHPGHERSGGVECFDPSMPSPADPLSRPRTDVGLIDAAADLPGGGREPTRLVAPGQGSTNQ